MFNTLEYFQCEAAYSSNNSGDLVARVCTHTPACTLTNTRTHARISIIMIIISDGGGGGGGGGSSSSSSNAITIISISGNNNNNNNNNNVYLIKSPY